MNEIGRHVKLAIVRYQERGANLSKVARISMEIGGFELTALYHQRGSAIEYATARQLMGVEE